MDLSFEMKQNYSNCKLHLQQHNCRPYKQVTLRAYHYSAINIVYSSINIDNNVIKNQQQLLQSVMQNITNLDEIFNFKSMWDVYCQVNSVCQV